MIYNDGVEMTDNGRVKSCPKCGNEQFGDSADYCRICGFPVFNLCEGTRTEDAFGNVVGWEQHKNAGNARFCEKCGQPTYFFKEKILLPYDAVREKYVRDYLTANPDAMKIEALFGGEPSGVLESEEEFPF